MANEMRVFTREEIYDIEREILSEINVWEADSDRYRDELMFYMEGVRAMTDTVLRRMKQNGNVSRRGERDEEE